MRSKYRQEIGGDGFQFIDRYGIKQLTDSEKLTQAQLSRVGMRMGRIINQLNGLLNSMPEEMLELDIEAGTLNQEIVRLGNSLNDLAGMILIAADEKLN